MKRIVFIFSFIVVTSAAMGQGISFSYFFPTDGYLSNPISPFSIRGVGVNVTRFLKVETGFSLYHMAGVGISGLPEGYVTDQPLAGPHFTLIVPGELALQFGLGPMQFKFGGGLFGIYHLNPRINQGNFDRMLVSNEAEYDVVNADLEGDNTLGFGWLAGGEIAIAISRQFALSLGTHFLNGSTAFPLSGSVTSARSGSSVIRQQEVVYDDTRIETRGWEVSLGVTFTSRR